jgi:hypothetical protein
LTAAEILANFTPRGITLTESSPGQVTISGPFQPADIACAKSLKAQILSLLRDRPAPTRQVNGTGVRFGATLRRKSRALLFRSDGELVDFAGWVHDASYATHSEAIGQFIDRLVAIALTGLSWRLLRHGAHRIRRLVRYPSTRYEAAACR